MCNWQIVYVYVSQALMSCLWNAKSVTVVKEFRRSSEEIAKFDI